jgi:hypothetical protein
MRYGYERRQITGQHRDQSEIIHRYYNCLKIKKKNSVINLQVIRFNIFFPNINDLNNGVRHVSGSEFNHIAAALFECHENFDIFVVTRFAIVATIFKAFFQQQQHPWNSKEICPSVCRTGLA